MSDITNVKHTFVLTSEMGIAFRANLDLLKQIRANAEALTPMTVYNPGPEIQTLVDKAFLLNVHEVYVWGQPTIMGQSPSTSEAEGTTQLQVEIISFDNFEGDFGIAVQLEMADGEWMSDPLPGNLNQGETTPFIFSVPTEQLGRNVRLKVHIATDFEPGQETLWVAQTCMPYKFAVANQEETTE
jgi:hypothetical protein